jgi:hypothetical protein
MMIGYMSAAMTLLRVLACLSRKAGQALEHHVRVAGRLARAHHAHVERREDARVLLDGLREGAALVDLLAHVAEDGLELAGLDLLDQRLERVVERDAGLEQRGQLARDLRQLLGGGLALAPDGPGGLLLAREALDLGDVRDQQPVAAQLEARLARVVGVGDARLELAGRREGLVVVDGHGPDLSRPSA